MRPVLTFDQDDPRQKGKTTRGLLVKESHVNLFGIKRVTLVASGDGLCVAMEQKPGLSFSSHPALRD
jgi:hypothetical protein